MSYDLIIRNGTVVDGSGNPRRRADVGVVDGRVAAVGFLEDETATEEIDATGRIVADKQLAPARNHSHRARRDIGGCA